MLSGSSLQETDLVSKVFVLGNGKGQALYLAYSQIEKELIDRRKQGGEEAALGFARELVALATQLPEALTHLRSIFKDRDIPGSIFNGESLAAAIELIQEPAPSINLSEEALPTTASTEDENCFVPVFPNKEEAESAAAVTAVELEVPLEKVVLTIKSIQLGFAGYIPRERIEAKVLKQGAEGVKLALDALIDHELHPSYHIGKKEKKRFAEFISENINLISANIVDTFSAAVSQFEARVLARVINGLSKDAFVLICNRAISQPEFRETCFKIIFQAENFADRAERIPTKLLMLAYRNPHVVANKDAVPGLKIKEELMRRKKLDLFEYLSAYDGVKSQLNRKTFKGDLLPSSFKEVRQVRSQEAVNLQLAEIVTLVKAFCEESKIETELMQQIKMFEKFFDKYFANLKTLAEEVAEIEAISEAKGSKAVKEDLPTESVSDKKVKSEIKQSLELVLTTVDSISISLARNTRLRMMRFAADDKIRLEDLPEELLTWGSERANIIFGSSYKEFYRRLEASKNLKQEAQ